MNHEPETPFLNVTRCAEDQFGDTWVEITKGSKSCWISIGDFSKNITYGFDRLRSIGINVLADGYKQKVKLELQKSVSDEQILVARRPGYIYADGEDVPVAYAYGSGDVIRPSGIDGPEILVGFDPIANFGCSGDAKIFQTEIGKLTKDQALPILCICVALAPILQPFTPDELYVENPIVELCGKTTSYKSAAAIGGGGALWGGIDSRSAKSKLGFFASANATINAIEENSERYNNSLMGIDETTAFAAQKKGRAEAIGHFVHRLSLETPKARFGDTPGLPLRTFAFLTSNNSFASTSEESAEVLEALQTRLITFQIPNRQTLIFDHIPKGFNSASSAGLHFYSIGMKNYGHVARKMIRKTLKHANNDLTGLQTTIGKTMRSIMNDVNFDRLDPPDQRRFKIIALAYAAGYLAKKWGVLNETDFGMFKQPLLRAWRLATQGVSPATTDRYLTYLRENADTVIVVNAKKRKELSDEEFRKKKAFIVSTRDGRLVAAFPPHFMKKRFPGFEVDFNRMRNTGVARCDEYLQTKLRVRQRDGKDKQDWFYAFYLDGWPLK